MVNEVDPVRGYIFLLRGPVNSALYDLKKGEVYSVNPLVVGVLEGELSSGGVLLSLRQIRRGEQYAPTRSLSISEGALQVIKGRLTTHPTFAQYGNERVSKGVIQGPSHLSGPIGLDFVWLELTRACNLSCVHCYAEAGVEYANELSLGQWKEILEEGARLGARGVQFTGGEPTLCPGLTDLIGHARSCQYKDIEVFTNATRLEDRLLRRWATLGVKVALSFYSYDPDTHDSITRSAGSFGQTVQGIKALLSHQIPVRVCILLTRENLSHLRGTIEFVRGLGLKAQGIEYDLVRPTGRGVAEVALLDKGDAETALSELLRLAEDGRAACNEGLAQGTCWKGMITISSEGIAYPCIFARQLPIGKFPEMRLEEIIQGQTVQRLWQITLEEVETCKDCELRYGCFDCRALAQTAAGDLLSKNPRCQYNPYTGLVEGDGGKRMKERLKTRIDLINETVGDEVVIYDPKNHNVHHLNPMAGVIWELCDGGHTPKEIAEEVVSVLETDPVQVERDVAKTIEEFLRKGLLEVV